MVLTLLILILIVLIGLGIGIALAYIAKEELMPSAKLFRVMQGILLLSILFFLFSNLFTRIYYLTSFMFLFGFPSGSLIMLEKFKEKKISNKTIIIYSIIYAFFIIILSILQLKLLSL